jgi:hypothetical protein
MIESEPTPRRQPVREFHQAVPPPGRYTSAIIPSEETLEERTAFTPFIGREAIYWEDPHVVHVKIARITLGTHVERTPRCIQILMAGLRTHGLTFEEQICLMGNLEHVSGVAFVHCYASCWSYKNAFLFFSPRTIEDVISIASRLPAGKTLLHDYTFVPSQPGSPIDESYPRGKIAAAVYDNLWKAQRQAMRTQAWEQPIIPVRRYIE